MRPMRPLLARPLARLSHGLPRAALHPTVAGLVVALVVGMLGAAGVTAPAALAAGCPASGGATLPRATASGDVVFRGGGWGHGLGMSQYGAQGAARLGCTARQILTRYYAGTTVRPAAMPTSVSLRMLDNGYRADVAAQTGDLSWELAGCTASCPPVQPKGSTWQLRLDDTATQYVLWNLGTTPKTAVWQGGSPAQKLRLRHAGTVVHLTTWKASSIYLDRTLRWDWTRFGIDTTATGPARLDAVQVIEDDANATAMNKYLWGIAEVPVSWTNGAQEALKAQAIAARTYAAKRAGAVLMPTPADQNYTGYAKELEDEGFRDKQGRNLRWRAAVDETAGQVVTSTSTGAMIDTFYSSSVGGHTEDERYVWGVNTPSLRAVDDSRWELASSNPAANRAWAKAFSWSTLAKKLRFSSISAISVPKRGSTTRVAGVKVVGVRSGAAVTTYLEGWDVRQALGLLSPGFEISMGRIGGASATPIVGDWNGDGTDEPGWFRRGAIALRITDATGTWVKRYRFGAAGDVPVVGDWNGDGVDEVGVFRAGTWLLRNAQSGGAADLSFRYGAAGDRPVVGRWKGGKLGIGVVRRGRWLLRTTVTAGPPQVRFRLGKTTDRPVVGDWNGNGTTTVGVRRGKLWLVRDRLASGKTRTFRYGRVTDRPVVGDWDGNGTVTVGAVRGRTFRVRNGAAGGKVSRVVTFAG
jgi:stage II sporulation protein D